MPSTTFSLVKFNAREQAISTDLNRAQKLTSRDAQDVLKNGARRDSFTTQLGVPRAGATGEVVDRADDLGTISGAAGSFNITLSAGQAFMEIVTADPDASTFCPVRWAGQVVASIVPDAATHRVDLIVALTQMVDTDLSSRNILVDPVARTVAPANVWKTSNPLAALAVIPGVPGDYAPPAVPAGTIALWEVVTLNTDTEAADYRFIPRLWRRIESLGSCHGILENCTPESSVHLEAAAIDPPYLISTKVHRAVIDGEVVCAVPSANIVADYDSSADPLSAGVDAAKDVPCYLYLCGGRHAPQNGLASFTGGAATPSYSALRLVASLTVPLRNRATSDLVVAGVTIPKEGTLYCGVWFIAKGGHLYKSCAIDGDWIHAATTCESGAGNGPLIAAFTEATVVGANQAVDIHPPASSTMCNLALQAVDTAGSTTVLLGTSGAFNANLAVMWGRVEVLNQAFLALRTGVKIPTAGHFIYSGGAATTTVRLCATAYNMNVPRIG